MPSKNSTIEIVSSDDEMPDPVFSFTLNRSDYQSSVFMGDTYYETITPDELNGLVDSKYGVNHSLSKMKDLQDKNENQYLIRYMKNMMPDGRVKVKYFLPEHKWGRIQPDASLSLSLFHRPTRHTLARNHYVDFDMENCQPQLITQICRLNGIVNKACAKYCENPKTVRESIAAFHKLQPIVCDNMLITPVEQAKKLVLALFFGGTYDEWRKKYDATNSERMPFVSEMESEIFYVMERIYKDNSQIIADVVRAKPTWVKKHTSEKKRSIMAYFAQSVERRIQEACIMSLVQFVGADLSMIVPCQDGFMMLDSELKRINISLDDIVSGMNKHVRETFGLSIAWKVKPFDQVLPFPIPLLKWEYVAPQPTYAELKQEFEKTHCKIIETGEFVYETSEKTLVMAKATLVNAYEHMGFIEEDGKKKKRQSFIQTWLKDETIRRKDMIGVYPPDMVCPDNVYNAWRPFKMEQVTDWIESPDAVEMIKNHIDVICDHNKYVIEYFTKWIACVIQFPSIKLPMPVFVSKEGAGKGTIMRMMSKLLGQDKIFETQSPSEHVWGPVNGAMLNAYLVCLDEISKREMVASEGRIKGLITEPTMVINEKYIKKVVIQSYHKFIAFSNPDAYGNEPMTTTESDRRKFFVQCSDELVGKTEYFSKLYKYIDSKDAMRSVYEYFKTMPDVKQVAKMKLPEVEYHNELKMMSMPPLKLFLRHYLQSHSVRSDVLSRELYSSFKEWVTESGTKYECSEQQFACRIATMKVKGMSKLLFGPKRLSGWKIDIPTTRFDLGLDTQSTISVFMGNE